MTGYEIGSILTKGKDGHVNGLSKDDILGLTKEIEKVLSGIKVIRLEPAHISEIMSLSHSTGMTFYDASYVFYSIGLDSILLTDDREMYSKAKKLEVDVKKVEELFN